MKQQWSCGKTSEHKPKDRLQSAGPKRHLPCFLLLHLFSLIIWIEGNPAYVLVLLTEDLPVVLIYIYNFFFSDAFVRQRHFPPCFLLSGRIKRSSEETSSPVRETVIGLRPQVHLWGGATRRSRWVNSTPPPSLLFYFFLIFFNRVSLVFIFFHCFSSAVAFSNYSRTFFYNN